MCFQQMVPEHQSQPACAGQADELDCQGPGSSKEAEYKAAELTETAIAGVSFWERGEGSKGRPAQASALINCYKLLKLHRALC